MKKIITLLSIILFISCSSDDTEPANNGFKPTSESIVGKWMLSNDAYYEFSKENVYIYFGENTTVRMKSSSNEVEFGTFEYDPKTSVVKCNSNSGDSYTLNVDFKDEDSATFTKTTSDNNKVVLNAEKDKEVETPTEDEYYMPIGVYLTKGTWLTGEVMKMYVYPPYIGYPPVETSLPEHYKYIDKVEYYIDNIKVAESTKIPFNIEYTLPESTSIGNHKLSLKLTLNKTNVDWKTLESTFSVIEKEEK